MGGGTGVIFRINLGCRDVTDDVCNGSTIEFTAVTFQYHGFTILFMSIYIPPNRSKDKQYMTQLALLLEGILSFQSDYTILAGDYNVWHSKWGSDRDDSRGRKLLKLMGEFGFSPLVMPSPTRFGNVNERDTYPDVFFVSDHASFTDTLVGPRLSDHAFCQCTMDIDLEQYDGHHVFDFRVSYQNHTEDLVSYFDNIDVLNIFTGCSLDGLSDTISGVILDAWKNNGVVKYVNYKSKPWFVPEVKRLSSDAGRWQKRYRNLKSKGKNSGTYNGEVVTVDECRRRWKDGWADHKSKLRDLKVRNNDFVCKLAEGNCHKVLKTGHKSVPR